MNILRYKNFLMEKLKDQPGSEVLALYIDFSKAFQKVNHNILLQKLRTYKISGQIGIWITNWLSMRKMRVNVNGFLSDFADVTSGVVEGSCLGPELFKLLLLDIPEHKEDPSHLLLSFADDTKLIQHIKSTCDVQKFQEHVNEFYRWAKTSHMKFNSTKFQAILFKEKNSAGERPVIYNDKEEPVPLSDVVNDLGILIDSSLSFSQELNKIIQKCNSRMYWILRTFATRKPEILMPVFKCMVNAVIDFSNLVLPSPTSAAMSRLEGVQRRFTAKLNGMQGLDYEQRLSALKINSIQRRKDRGTIMFMQRITQLGPELAGLEPPKGNRYSEYNYHTQTHGDGDKDKNKASWINSFFRASAAFSGPRLFNDLPILIKSSSPENANKTKKLSPTTILIT